ncbi:LysR family transcriptional regulator [Rubrivivax gelatinosus]|uniref:LysR family transcriptional regulator n=1 Tax=Rubrivivax gelatinosus TaxID=28068 RepID=A0ABS1E228_RUBGE|nr:LysR family transcriptional regulator [Rubrivivax gelatinosus]MBK1715803.1 LysR family transcriptional regulator [Rubrivivax gelatinosus]
MTSHAVLSPEDLRIFLRVAELASFTEAAQRLGLPRATVSTAVRRLEERLGTRLLQRTTRRVQTTDDGRAFVERCQDVLADLDELRTLFQHQPQALTGRLRVDMPLAMARELVLPRLPEFLEQHPGLTVEIGSSDRRVDPVREGYDAVIRVGAVVAEQLVARPLGRFVMVNVASPGYVARHGEPRSLDELASHRLVHYQPNLGDRPVGFEYLGADGTTHGVEMAGVVTVNTTDAYVAACEAGLGIIQIPEASAREGVAAGRLVTLLPGFVPPPMPITLLLPHRRHLPRRVRAFADWVLALFEAQR